MAIDIFIGIANERMNETKGDNMAGNVATQQALRFMGKLSFRSIAAICGINHRTVWQHCAAGEGSNVTPWHLRSSIEQYAALENANRLLREARERGINSSDIPLVIA